MSTRITLLYGDRIADNVSLIGMRDRERRENFLTM
jgi:hypothetical protein